MSWKYTVVQNYYIRTCGKNSIVILICVRILTARINWHHQFNADLQTSGNPNLNAAADAIATATAADAADAADDAADAVAVLKLA